MLRNTLLAAIVMAASTLFALPATAADLPVHTPDAIVSAVIKKDPGFRNDPETLRDTIAKGSNFGDGIIVRRSCGTC